MGQALYRKYRSRSFDEVVGQEHVTKTLKNALKSGRISHAYLFTGPRGVGKTSVARILAHEVNKLPYDGDSIHLDIIEIDAASNRRIDEIRDLREKVHIAPTSAQYKVYIIDEVHMLTREAFNALLKTLEEPPEHCIFILATTEAHKLPETIISRTQRFNFKPINGKGAVEHLESIAKKERIRVDPQALQLIAQHGEGSFRDSIGILDQLSSMGDDVSLEDARQFLGLPPKEAIDSLIKATSDGNSSQALQILNSLKDQGSSAPKIASQLAKSLRDSLVVGQAAAWVPSLLRQLLLVPSSPSPFDQLEISILEVASRDDGPHLYKNTGDDDEDEKQLDNRQNAGMNKATETKTAKIKQPGTRRTKFDLSLWPEVTERVKAEAASIYTALRLASPSLDDKKLILAFQFPLHQKKVSQAKNLDVIGSVIEEVSGEKITLRCVVDKNIMPDAGEPALTSTFEVSSKDEEAGSVKTISNIFGAAEVLES